MKNNKRYAVTFISSGLTYKQASRLQSSVVRAKNRIAPNSRGTGMISTIEGIAHALQKGWKQVSKGVR